MKRFAGSLYPNAHGYGRWKTTLELVLDINAEVVFDLAMGVDANGIFLQPSATGAEFLIHKIEIDGQARAALPVAVEQSIGSLRRVRVQGSSSVEGREQRVGEIGGGRLVHIKHPCSTTTAELART